MWGICQICGAVIADEQLHADWHAAHGDVAPQPDPIETEVVPDGH